MMLRPPVSTRPDTLLPYTTLFRSAFRAALEAGQTVAVVEPSYPAYRGTLKAVNLVPYRLGTDAATRYQVTPAMIDALPPEVAGVVVASPANQIGRAHV